MAKLTVVPEGVCVETLPNESILEALQRAGYAYRVGCRRGGCGLCKVQVVSGEVNYLRPLADKVLGDDERQQGVAISCRGVPLDDLTITLRNDVLRDLMPFRRSTSPGD